MTLTATTVPAFVAEVGITAEVVDSFGLQRDASGWEHFASTVRLTHAESGRTIDVDWRAGTAHTEGVVEAEDVVNSLRLDSEAGQLDLQEFCSEFGYDLDDEGEDDGSESQTRLSQTRLIHKACVEVLPRVVEFLGQEAFDRLLSGDVEAL